jgi:hypothetical protein
MNQNRKENVIIVEESCGGGGGDGDNTVVSGDNGNDGETSEYKNGDLNKARKSEDDKAALSRRRGRLLRRLLRNTPRSELWYPHELQTQIYRRTMIIGAMTSMKEFAKVMTES